MDRDSNAAFYGSSSMTPEQIFASSGNAAPAVANNFVQLLTAQTRRLPKQPGMETGVASSSASIGASNGRSVPSQPSVKTYGIADPDAGSVVADDSQDF